MKKIIILHHVSAQGGGTKSLLDMAVMLQKNYEVVICLPKGSKETIAYAQKYGITCYEVKTPIPSLNIYSGFPGYLNRYFLSRLMRFRYNKKLVEELMGLKPDAIFFNTVVTTPIAKDIPDTVKNVCIVRETFRKSIFNRIYKKVLEKKFAGVAYIAKHEKSVINLTRPIQTVVPDCLEPREVQQYSMEEARSVCNLPQNKFCVLFMGGMVQIKGLDILLKAMQRMDENYVAVVGGTVAPDILKISYIMKHFYNIGYAKYLLCVRKLLPRMVKDGKIVLAGYVQDVAPYFSACDTVVFPSTSAHQPRPGIEAGVFHKSVVLSDYKATKEYFLDGYNAVVFAPGNGRQLAEKIRYLREHPGENERLAENNYKASEQKHNYKATQDKLKRFFEYILRT